MLARLSAVREALCSRRYGFRFIAYCALMYYVLFIIYDIMIYDIMMYGISCVTRCVIYMIHDVIYIIHGVINMIHAVIMHLSYYI